jgi:pre-mRNA-processing factor 19
VTKQPLSRDDLLPAKTNKARTNAAAPLRPATPHGQSRRACATLKPARYVRFGAHMLLLRPPAAPAPAFCVCASRTLCALQVIKPRSNAATSIPGLLSIFHNEWDALMLETATLRESLDARNRELATSLYQYDAACRVIARLSAERDEARAAAAAAPAGGAKRGGDAMDVDASGGKKPKSGLMPDVLALISDTAASLSKGRKKRVISAELATPEALASYVLAETVPLHKSSTPGIAALALHAASNRILSGGADKVGVVYDRGASVKLAELKGHTKEVTCVAWASDGAAALTGSADKSARLWAAEDGGRGGFRLAATLADHAGAVTALAAHPCASLAVTASADATWAMYDLPTATCLVHVADAGATAPLHAAAFHPDGLILGTGGADGAVRIWDVKSGANAAKFDGHAGGPVSSLSFSENGYYLATGGADGVKLWDLRKLKCFSTLTPFGDGAAGGVACVAFDASGHYLAVGGAHAAVFGAKQEWGVVKAFEPLGPKKRVAALAWGADARVLAAGATADHNLRLYAEPK